MCGYVPLKIIARFGWYDEVRRTQQHNNVSKDSLDNDKATQE